MTLNSSSPTTNPYLQRLMNTFSITITMNTYSESPEDWITESIIDQLEDGEELLSVEVETIDEPSEATGWN